jgi:predicted DCC family thiol-disulfide oxidoreductase YuxK
VEGGVSERSPGPLILFDGVCNLCNAAVQWVIERDRRGIFRFGALQSEAGRAALSVAGTTEDLPDSIVLMDGAGTHTRSDAAIRIARGLGFPWSLAAVALAVPRPLRDAVYSWVARNRYRWFGRRESCMVPTAELAARFVDAASLR